MKTALRHEPATLLRLLAAAATVIRAGGGEAIAQTTVGSAFPGQGRLKDADSPANGLYDLRFRLYDALVAGSQVGPTVCAGNVDEITSARRGR